MAQNPALGNLKASYGPNLENRIFLLIGISLCAVGGLVLLVIGFGQSYMRDKVMLSGGGVLLLLIGMGLYFVYRSQLRISVEVYNDGFVFTDRRAQRHICRWDDVTEVYEMLIYRDPARPGQGIVGGKYTVRQADGRQIKLGVSVQDSKSLGAIIQARVRKRLLSQAIETYQSGGTVAFGPRLSLSQQGVTSGRETLPWSEVTRIKLGKGARILRKGKQRPWKSITHAGIANYPVLREMMETINLKPQDGQPAGSAKEVPAGGIGNISARLGVDVRDLLMEGYGMHDIHGVLEGKYDLDELRRKKPRRAKRKITR